MYDLIVIGGGPAGSAAAITAARRGASVLLLERGKFPRHKVCGEFVSAESLALLKTLLVAEHTELLQNSVTISQARLFLEGQVASSTVDPPAASIARFDLDQALWESAERCGVKTLQQSAVSKVSGKSPFRVDGAAGEFESRAVVNASGRWSNLNRHRNHPPDPKWLGIKAHFAEPVPANSVDLYFFDGGYCGIEPVVLREPSGKQGRINVCAMVRADVATSLAQVFASHTDLRSRSESWKLLSEPVSTSPLVFREPEPVEDNILMTGDAAVFVDPFVGDGISLALRSGSLAAECLEQCLRGEESVSDAANRYRLEYERRFTPVFHASRRIRRMLLLPRMLRKSGAAILARRPELTRYLMTKTR